MSDLVTKDTPSILDSEDMVGEAKQIIDSVPTADIEGMHSPEELAEARNTFWKAFGQNQNIVITVLSRGSSLVKCLCFFHRCVSVTHLTADIILVIFN